MKNTKVKLGTKTPVRKRDRAARGSKTSTSGIFSVIYAFFSLLFKILAIVLSAAAGNYIGDKLRAQVTKKPGHQLEFLHTDEHGNMFIAANLLISNYFPGLFMALIARPRWMFAFLGGLSASFILGDRYEDWLWEKMDELLTGGDPTRNWPEPVNPQPTYRPHP